VSSSKKIQNIQGLRGIAVLLVVLAHMLPTEQKYAQFDYILPNWLEIGGSGVDLFFLISGFVMVAVTQQAFQSKLEIQRFLYHRFTRIYPLYWFYTTAVLVVWLLFPHLINNSQDNQVNILESFLLIPQNIYPLLMVAWTLIYEIYFYLIFAILLFFPKENLLLGLAVWTVTLIGGYYFLPVDNAFVSIYFGPLVIEFIAGCLVAKFYFSQEIRGNATIIALVALIFWAGGYALLQPEGRGWTRVLVFGVPSVLALYAALLYEKKHAVTMPKWLCQIGDASYSIYLSHILVLGVLGKVWQLSPLEGYADNIAALCFMFVSTLIIGRLSFSLIENFIQSKVRMAEQRLLFNCKV